MIITSILTIIIAFIELSGLPFSLLVPIEVLDIDPMYFVMMFNFFLIGIITFFTFKVFSLNWKLGFKKSGLGKELLKYGTAGIFVALVSFIAYYIGLKSFNSTPSLPKVLIEGIVYYIGVALVEELYVRGLFLNLIEKLLYKSKHNTLIAIIISSVVFGVSHIFGSLGQPIFEILAKMIWTTSMGIYFGVIYKKTNNLIIPIILHFLIDVAALPFCFKALQSFPNVTLYILLPTYIILGVCSFCIIFKKDNNNVLEEKGKN